MSAKKPKIGLALGAGGARGLAHIGVLKKLEAEGIRPDYIAGASMGSIIGGLYSLGWSAAEIEKEAGRQNSRLLIFKKVDLSLNGHGLIKGRKIFGYLQGLFGEAGFKDAKIPFRAVCTDLEKGKEVVIKDGGIAQAVLASISVPGIFPPVRTGKSLLVDGGLVNPTPINVVDKMGADIIIGVDLIMRKAAVIKKPGLINVLMQSYEIIRTENVKNRIKPKGKKMVIIKPSLSSTVDSFKFTEVKKFIDSGEKAAEMVIPRIKKLLD